MNLTQTPLRELFNFKDERAKGRCCMLLTYACGSIIPMLSGGLFHTSFLTKSGINIVELGILSLIQFIAKCFSIFCPSVLERFKRRKLVLGLSRFGYYTFSLLSVTLIPYFVHDPTLKMVLFISSVFIANVIYAIFNGGYIVWHLNFIPDDVRVDYFSVNTFVSSALGSVASIAASVIADILAGSAYEDTIIVVLRFVAYGIGMLDVLALSLPKEFPYKQESHPKLRDIVTKPFTHKPFIITMAVVALFTFFQQLPASAFSYHLLNVVGIEYTLSGAINVIYSLFIILLMPFWQKVIRRIGWLKTFAICELLYVPTTLVYSFISSENYLWLFPLVRLTQHVIAVGLNISNANLLYVNMPDADQTNYVSFHELTINVAGLLGTMAGTWFIDTFPNISVTLFGFTFVNVKLLMWAQMLSQLLIPFFIFKVVLKVAKQKSAESGSIC